MPCDVSRPEEIRALVDHAIERFGRLDCLFNNAGYHPSFGPIDEVTMEELNRILQTNFVSQVVACQCALPHLRKTRGSIINMSSCAATLGQEGGAIYSATKGAICSFTRSLALDEARHGVRVNAVLPGNIFTESRVQTIRAMGARGTEVDRWVESLQPLGRSGTPEEVGQVVLFLAGAAASYLTGVEIIISGGLELGMGIKPPPLWV
jgi:NAD(P)-dependent dehydrogenase (short-subunit alcohol dehydrogenase family)